MDTMTETLAYELGLDKAKNGANEVNCNFRIFSKPEFTKAWERGASGGKKI